MTPLPTPDQHETFSRALVAAFLHGYDIRIEHGDPDDPDEAGKVVVSLEQGHGKDVAFFAVAVADWHLLGPRIMHDMQL